MKHIMKYLILVLTLLTLAAVPLSAPAGTETALVFTANTFGEHSPCPS